jgi:spore maturation protein CgeB
VKSSAEPAWEWRDYNGYQIPALLQETGSWPIDEEPDSPVLAHYRAKVLEIIEGGGDFLYLMGAGAGFLLKSVSSRIVNVNRGILVIEPNIESFYLALHVTDFQNLFINRRIFWAVGPHLEDQIESLFQQTLCFAAEKPFFYAGTRLNLPHHHQQLEDLVAWMKPRIQTRKKEYAHIIQSLTERLKDRPAEPRRIWTYLDIRGRAQYSLIQQTLIQALMDELENLGYETEYTVLEAGRYYPPYYRIYQMACFEPDVLFLCNEAPATEISLGAEYSRSLPIPKIIWYADDPLYAEHLLERSKLSEDEIYLIADYEWADTLRNHGATRIHFMPGAATTTTPGPRDDTRRCQLVFVGQVRDQSRFFQQLAPPWKEYCQKVIAEKLRFPRKKVRDIMEQFTMPSPLASDLMDDFRQKVLWEANTQFRVNIIKAMLDYDLHVYGNPDWLQLIPQERFKECFKGILPFEELFRVYRNADIVLNIHSLQSYTCMNVRDFDVPAAGGFLLSDWLPRAEEVYTPGFAGDLPYQDESGKEVFFYRSIPELKKLVDYFLENPEDRERCIARSREKVLAHHLYKHRAEFIHQLIQDTWNE